MFAWLRDAITRWHYPFLGDRVRLKRTIETDELGLIPAGVTGTVTWVDSTYPTPAPFGEPVIEILLDQHFDALREWENKLQISDLTEVCWGDFKRIRS